MARKKKKNQKLFDHSKIWRLGLLLKFLDAAREYRDNDLSIILSPHGQKQYERTEFPEPLIYPSTPKKITLSLQKMELTDKEKRKRREQGDMPYLLKTATFNGKIDIADDTKLENRTNALYKEIVTLTEYANVRMQVYNYNNMQSKFKLCFNEQTPGIDYQNFLITLTMYAGHLLRDNVW
ncbi:hypothetical protein KY312_04680 [Candidatus Woesearchaeota archaeon]|nr:hypothetical protein [Candidatus Woesearchaeota archaeon]